jgi:hypothetical protein
VFLRSPTESFNRLYEFATRGGRIYVRARDGNGPWRQLPLPLCFDGRVASISLDDDELIALDDSRRIYTMDNALKDPTAFNWTNRWGTPFWTGPGYTLPATKAWSWSVISPLEDKNWTDPAGNRTAVGSGKVSHIWGLRRGGQRITFWDPWLPLDESYEMCGPHRGRFKAVNLSASGSFVFVIGRRGDMFTPHVRLRHLRPRRCLLRLLVRGPAAVWRRLTDSAARRPLGRTAEDSREDHVGDLDQQDRRRRHPPHPRVEGKREVRPATGSATWPIHRRRAGSSTPPACRSRASACATRAATHPGAASAEARTVATATS